MRDKIFVMVGPDGRRAGVKASLDDQAGLVEAEPETFSVASYTGRFGWVAVDLATVNPDLMRMLVVAAWRRAAPKRLAWANDAPE